MGKKYIDNRGWKYQVMSGLGENRFKARYQRPEKHGDIGWKGLAAVPWRGSREEAQSDLDQQASRRVLHPFRRRRLSGRTGELR